MNILLIRGPGNKKAIDLSHYTFSEPLGLQMLYSLLSEKHNVEIFDMLAEKTPLEKKLKEKKYELCGISSACSDIFMIKELARKIKQIEDIPIFVGGYQIKKTPELFKSRFIDFIVLETNRWNIWDMIEKVKNPTDKKLTGVLEKAYDFSEVRLRGVEEGFEINRACVEKNRKAYSYFIYKPADLIEFYGKSSVIEELRNTETKYITFIDMDFFKDRQKVTEFFLELNGLNIRKKFLAYGTRKSLENLKEYYGFLKENGLESVILFFGERDRGDIELVKNLKKSGINVWAYFNLDPQMSKGDFKRLREYIGKLGVDVATLYPLNPFYSKELVEKYRDNLIYKREIRANRYPGYVLIKPFEMSLKEYYAEILKTTFYAYRWSLIKFPRIYGIRNSFGFFWKSMTLLFKYLKIIYKAKS